MSGARLAGCASAALSALAVLGVLYVVAHVVRALFGIDLMTAIAAVLGLAVGLLWLAVPFLSNRRAIR